VLVLGVALYLLDSLLLFKKSGKKASAPTNKNILIKKSIKAIAIIIIAGATCRLFMPNYLISVNPMILQDMVKSMQNQKTEQSSSDIRKYIKNHSAEMMADAPILGNVDAKKTIFVFTDYSCPYCRRVDKELERVIKERNDVRIVVKNFVVHGPLSEAPARAVIAAKLQGDDKAAALHTALMSKDYYDRADLKDQSKLDEKITKSVMKIAEKVSGLDIKKLKTDMQGEVVSREFKQVRELAQRFEINGTPFLIINDQAFPGAIPYDQIIDALN
jgi:protein-disulfide isomerase